MLSADAVTKSFGTGVDRTHALAELSLRVREGEFVSLVGPSGCGKSTLLHMLGGHEAPSAGRVSLGDSPVLGPGAELGIVFQTHSLFPWLTVEDNVRFPYTLRHHRRVSEEVARERVEQLLRIVGLWDFRARHPHELSGGMQQRASIARALAIQPRVLLLDEPFGALDAQTREEMQELLLRLTEHHRTTSVLVTHDVEEALLLSDRVLVLSPRPGRIVSELEVGFDRERRSAALRLEPAFLALKREIHEQLRARGPEHGRDDWLRGLMAPGDDQPDPSR